VFSSAQSLVAMVSCNPTAKSPKIVFMVHVPFYRSSLLPLCSHSARQNGLSFVKIAPVSSFIAILPPALQSGTYPAQWIGLLVRMGRRVRYGWPPKSGRYRVALKLDTSFRREHPP